jgi:ABC-type ATPase with predicted acetyltransferase domain
MSRPNFLPGRLRISRGTWRDYRQLARFHYRPGRPGIPLTIWTIRYHAPGDSPRVVAVAVLSHPMRIATGRRRAIGLRGSMGDDLRFINRYVRTISRVIVHPQFRALGLSSRLVRWVCKNCQTRYVEALAQMGWAIPFFERAGMRRFDPPTPNAPVYYLHRTDRKN